jgi:hypothetical protein
MYARLASIGHGPASFYRDACRIMEANPPFEAATHLVGHCLREIESALRKVLLNLASTQSPPPSGGGDRHEREIRFILRTLDVPEADPVTHLWLRLVQQQEQYGLHTWAHRHHLAEPRPLDDEFVRQWQDMHTLFDRLVDVLEAHYLFAHQLIDLRVLDETVPPAVRVNFLRESIPQNDVSLRYFFGGIGKLQAAEWLIPLRDAGYFRHPPTSVFDARTQTTSLPPWPASQYLVQIANVAPQQVCEVILAIPASENVHVWANCLDAVCQMPAAIAQQLVPRAINWLDLSYQWLLPEKAGALIKHLAQGGESAAALHLFAAFLDRFPHLSSTYDPWNYARILRQALPVLLTSAGLRVIDLLTERLGECLSTDETDIAIAYRYSSSWRPMIETIGEERMEEMGGIGHLLISLLRQAAELAIRQRLAPIGEVLTPLQAHPSFVFSRLVLYLLSLFPDQAPEVVASALTNRQFFANADVRREYVLLLQAAFGHLAPDDQETILRWIEDGPGNLAEQRATYERYNREPFTDEMATRYRQQWQRDWYARFGPALPSALKPRYAALLEECGPAELPETTYPRFSIGSWVPSSPKSVEELATMEVRELVAFLKTWRPEQPEDPQRSAPSVPGLLEALKSAASAAPQRFSRYGRHFRALSPDTIVAILKGLIEAIKQQQSISWSGALDLCFSVARKRTRRTREGRITTQPQWKDACWQALELLTLGCREVSSALPLSLRERVWMALHPLTLDSNPTSAEERPFDSDRRDRIDLAETTVRGKALIGVLAYAEWVMRPSNQEEAGAETDGQRPEGGGLPVEVQAVLDRHLEKGDDPSPAVHSFYGQAIPRLHQLDPAWTARQLERIFPRGEVAHPYRQAAWDAYCAFWRPGTALFAFLEDEYRYAIGELERYARPRASAFEPEGWLVSHLILLACQGVIAPNEPGGLLGDFFAKAPRALRWLFWEGIGTDLARISELLSDGMRFRLQALWEWRLAELLYQREQGTVDAGELAPFRWWFTSGKFPAGWSLRQLEATLRLHGTVDAPATMAERLAELSEAAPLPAARCLALLLPATRDAWKPGDWSQQVRVILDRALSCDNGEARQLAIEVVHRLGAQGEDYRDVLEQALPTPTAESL